MKKKKSPLRFTVRLLLPLLLMAEVLLVTVCSWGVTALLDYLLHITVVIPDIVWVIVISILLGGVITSFLSRWFFEPIAKLGDAMHCVAAGDYGVTLETGKGFQVIRSVNADFNRMTKELRATEILQTDFVSNVSHEIKTPIGAIEGYAMLLQSSTGDISPIQAQYVEKILFNTKRLSKLVGNILLLSKVDNQAISEKTTTYRLDEQIRQSILLLEPEWSGRGVALDVELDCITYTGSESLLLHVWNNLIGNAVKFSPAGGSVALRLFRQKNAVIFTVTDEGPGISPAEQGHIFDKFYQSDSSRREEGNGLGLPLVRQILTLSGGQVAVENTAPHGCRFTVTLPETAPDT